MNTVLPSHCRRLSGSETNPVVIVIGGTHGDERTGVEVIRKLEECLQEVDVHGTLYLIIGNPEAVSKSRRSASGFKDLNRCFIQEDLDRESQSNDSYDLKRARELAPILSTADFVIDIHSTSNPSPPFIVTRKDTPEIRELLRLLPVRFLLTDPNGVLAADIGQASPGTTDAYVEAHGGIAIGYETGLEVDVSRVNEVTDDIMRLLRHIGSVYASQTAHYNHSIHTQKIFALSISVQAHVDSFTYAVGMDRGWIHVHAGDLIGRYDDGTEERAGADGMLLFPKAEKKIRKNENLYYLAEETDIVS